MCFRLEWFDFVVLGFLLALAIFFYNGMTPITSKPETISELGRLFGFNGVTGT